MFKEKSEGTIHAIPANVNFIEELRHEFGLFLSQFGIGLDLQDAWKLVLTESTTNAIQHGCKHDASKKVFVTWWVYGEAVFLEVRDPGPGLPPELQKNPSLPQDPYATNGRGLYLIASLTDRWEHWTGFHGYRQILVKSHPGIRVENNLEEILERALQELSQCYESLAAFYRLGDALIHSDKVSTFIHSAIESFVKIIPLDCMYITFNANIHPHLLEDLKTIPIYFAEGAHIGIQAEVIQRGREEIWENVSEIKGDPILGTYGCGICSPIRVGNETLGALSLARTHEIPYLTAAELKTIRTFSDLFAIAIAHANVQMSRIDEQRALQEIEIAADMQKRLLPVPHLPENPTWNLFAERQAAREVSGDYVDAIILPQGDILMIIVDVMGKGLSAAFLAAMIKTALKIKIESDFNLKTLIQDLNLAVHKQVGDMTLFATCSIIRVHKDLNRLEGINAGHCPPLLFRSANTYETIEPSGPPLGLFEDASYEVTSLDLDGNEQLILVTDGLYEWPFQGDIWGWENFIQFIQTHYNQKTPHQVWDTLLGLIQLHSENHGIRDDQTMLWWELRL